MSQITYANKDNTAIDNIANKWRDVDANEVKTAVNTKEDVKSGITAAGTNTYTATDNTGVTSYVTGQKFHVIFTNACSGASTLNINSLGAKTIKKNVSFDISTGDVLAGQALILLYDGTNFQIIGGLPVQASTALTDAATIDITGAKHTLTSTAGRTFTISYPGDDIIIELTLNATSATYTFPATTLCVYNGTSSGNNTAALSGTSGDKYIIGIFKIGSNYYVSIKSATR